MVTPVASNNYSLGFGTQSTGNLLPIISKVAPASTNITGPNGPFQIGQRWINSASNIEYVLTSIASSNGALSATWTTGAGGTITSILGTANQITASTTADVTTLSLPSSITTPGSLSTTTTLTAGTGLTVTSGGAAITGTTNINTSGAGVTTIGVGGTGLVTIGNGTGNVTIPCGLAVSLGLTGNLGCSITGGQIILQASGMGINISTQALADVINIGTGLAIKTITLGSPTTGATLALQSGLTSTGGISYNSSLYSTAGAIATTATDGFLYLASCAGAPTGVPTGRGASSASVPMVIDTTDSKIYVYIGGTWKSATVA